LRKCLHGADLVSCNSGHTREEIRRLAGLEATVVPYGSTVAPCHLPVRATFGSPATLLFSGRLIQRKGLPYLLRALPYVLQECPVRLLLTGEGDQRAALEALVQELGISQHVEFLGFVENARLAELYRDCDIYVHPAIVDDRGDTEGLGVVLIEVLNYGRPVVASNVGGIPDVIVHEETGLLVPEKDAATLAAAIVRLLRDPELAARLGTNGRAHVNARFAWDPIILEAERLCYLATRQPRSEAVLSEALT
jgi:glycosyltransferase involved in cell wall biosynthesis